MSDIFLDNKYDQDSTSSESVENEYNNSSDSDSQSVDKDIRVVNNFKDKTQDLEEFLKEEYLTKAK